MRVRQILIVILAMLLFAGSSKGQESRQSVVDVEFVTLEEVLKKSKTYDGKEVITKGVFNSVCCASDFVLKDGFDAIEVYVTEQCPMPSKSKLGSKMKVQGTVKVKGNELSIVAKEIKFE